MSTSELREKIERASTRGESATNALRAFQNQPVAVAGIAVASELRALRLTLAPLLDQLFSGRPVIHAPEVDRERRD